MIYYKNDYNRARWSAVKWWQHHRYLERMAAIRWEKMYGKKKPSQAELNRVFMRRVLNTLLITGTVILLALLACY